MPDAALGESGTEIIFFNDGERSRISLGSRAIRSVRRDQIFFCRDAEEHFVGDHVVVVVLVLVMVGGRGKVASWFIRNFVLVDVFRLVAAVSRVPFCSESSV